MSAQITCCSFVSASEDTRATHHLLMHVSSCIRSRVWLCKCAAGCDMCSSEQSIRSSILLLVHCCQHDMSQGTQNKCHVQDEVDTVWPNTVYAALIRLFGACLEDHCFPSQEPVSAVLLE